MIITNIYYHRFLCWLRSFTEPPRHGRLFYPLAGLYECLWARNCGHDWKFALRMGRIYWCPRDSKEAPFEAILAASDKMVIEEAKAQGDDLHAIAERARERLSKAMAEADRRLRDNGDGK